MGVTPGVRRDESFEEAFDLLFPRARRLAYRMLGDAAAAEDVAAEALARAYANWGKLRDLAHRDGWVLRVATNLAVDSTRKRRALLPAPARHELDDDTAVRLAL